MVLQRFLSLVLKRFLSLVLKRFLSLVLHRFLISSPDLRIDARFRCRIRIINDVRVRFQSLLRREEWPACSGCGGNEFRIRF